MKHSKEEPASQYGNSLAHSPHYTDERTESAVDCCPGDAGENEGDHSGFENSKTYR
ncbi:MAG: hypothetical protein LBL07_20160 [Tannerella sp.]|jgi:hypothetical protein|nr:hypothetical protein [Tannerella sp.]